MPKTGCFSTSIFSGFGLDFEGSRASKMLPSWPKMRPAIGGRPLGSQLVMTGGFGEGLGRVWGGLGEGLGMFWGRFCEGFGKIWGGLGSVWQGLLTQAMFEE